MINEACFSREFLNSFEILKKFVEDRPKNDPFDYLERMNIMKVVEELRVTRDQISILKGVVNDKHQLAIKPGVVMTKEQIEWGKLFLNLGLYEQTVFDGVVFRERYQ